MADAFIYDHVRTPRGRGKPDGSLHRTTPMQLAAQTLQRRHIEGRSGGRRVGTQPVLQHGFGAQQRGQDGPEGVVQIEGEGSNHPRSVPEAREFAGSARMHPP